MTDPKKWRRPQTTGIVPSDGVPAAELDVDEILIRRLLADQFADLAKLRIRFLASGWDNVLFRLGDDLAVRMPRRQVAADLVEHEQTWLPRLAPLLPLSVPGPLKIGNPTSYYPWKWSVVPWIVGECSDLEEIDASQAEEMGRFLKALHQAAPADAPRNPVRGVPLTTRSEAMEQRLTRLSAFEKDRQQSTQISDVFNKIPAVAELSKRWTEALRVPIDIEATWLHGDLHPRNILVRDGKIVSVLDWGDICAGDPATDLACAWMLFDNEEQRAPLFAAYGNISTATRGRAEAWALLFGLMFLDKGLAGRPQDLPLGQRILSNLKL